MGNGTGRAIGDLRKGNEKNVLLNGIVFVYNRTMFAAVADRGR